MSDLMVKSEKVSLSPSDEPRRLTRKTHQCCVLGRGFMSLTTRRSTFTIVLPRPLASNGTVSWVVSFRRICVDGVILVAILIIVIRTLGLVIALLFSMVATSYLGVFVVLRLAIRVVILVIGILILIVIVLLLK